MKKPIAILLAVLLLACSGPRALAGEEPAPAADVSAAGDPVTGESPAPAEAPAGREQAGETSAPAESDVSAADEADFDTVEYPDGDFAARHFHTELPDPDEMLEALAAALFDPEAPVTDGFDDAFLDNLSERDRALYEALRQRILDVAEGRTSSTRFVLSAEELGVDGLEFTARDLGMVNLRRRLTNEAWDRLYGLFDIELVVCLLSIALPLESSWMMGDFYAEIHTGLAADDVTGEMVVTIEDMAIDLRVGSKLNPDSYKVRSSELRRARKAAENAAKIVEKYADVSDYEKLQGYAEEICALSSYNYLAADLGANVVGISPWTLVNVFDGDNSTQPLCLGYTAALQYLCDLTVFDGPVTCLTIWGELVDDAGAGGHAWNVLRLEGRSYLTDVTNMDDDGELCRDFFLAGAEGSPDAGYTIRSGGYSYLYIYDDFMHDVYGDEILTLSASCRDPGAPVVVLDPTGLTARAEGFAGLCARVALILENDGVSGLYVTQAGIGADGTIAIPVLQVPGLTVRAVNIALVPTALDIQSAIPDVLASDYRDLT